MYSSEIAESPWKSFQGHVETTIFSITRLLRMKRTLGYIDLLRTNFLDEFSPFIGDGKIAWVHSHASDENENITTLIRKFDVSGVQ